MIKRLKVGTRLSQIVVHGDTVYLAGIVADDAKANAGEQTKQILAKIEAYLGEVGSDKTKMLSATVWLADIKFYDEMNKVWDAWVPQGHAPARACIESKLANPELKVEIRVVAGI